MGMIHSTTHGVEDKTLNTKSYALARLLLGEGKHLRFRTL